MQNAVVPARAEATGETQQTQGNKAGVRSGIHFILH